ncbi:MAG: ParB/RepB/Spo0J family partition protein [Actinomycetota bacterium]
MTRRSGLGRGLDALLPQRGEEGDLESRDAQYQVPVGSIDPNPRQPRGTFEDAALGELAISIKELGVLQPLLVRPAEGGRFELIAGERRWRASKMAGLQQVPVMIVETDDSGSLERAIVENIHRSDLNPIEEGAAYKQLLEEAGLTQEALGDRLGKNRVTITNALRLLDLPPAVQRLLIDRRLTAGHGRALVGLNGNPFQERLARRVADEGLSVRETEDLARRYSEMTGLVTDATNKKLPVAEVVDAQRSLQEHLGTKVRVEMGKRKGRITVDFASVEDLARLMDVLLNRAPGATPKVVSLDED